MDWKKDYIRQSKRAVIELVKILSADIDYESISDETRLKAALSTKKETFITAKGLISNILELDYAQQEWVRGSISGLIDASGDSVDKLISGLGTEIIFEDSIGDNAADLRNAIKSRAIASADAIELIKAIDELKRLLREDEIVIKHNDFNGGYAEMYTDLFDNKDNKAGYYPEEDLIVLDPDGSIDEIIELCDLRIAMPKRPNRKTIQNFNRKPKDQYFRKEKQPRALTEDNVKAFEDYIEQQYKYKRKGYWFLNNGNYEYITGAHWFLLNGYRTGADGGYYYFTKAQQKLFWLLEAAWVDERSYGIILEKIRRFGATDCASCFFLCKGITSRDKILGMTSKVDKDARANFSRITHAFSNLPFYFKPLCLDEKSKSKLEFSTPSARLSKNNKAKSRVDNSLNTYFDFLATNEGSYDGIALYGYIADEFSKWQKQNGNTITHWEMVRKALTKGMRITGMAFILSTVEYVTGADPFENSDEAEAGDRYKWLYYNSDPLKRDENGRTLTGLYKVFISCYEHYEGLIDIYGYPITEDPVKPIKTINGVLTDIGIKTFIEREAAPFKDNPKALYDYYRKTPIVEEDGFRIGEDACMFNQVNILNQVNYNNSLPNKPYRKGNFEWEEIPDESKVVWRDNPNGRFRISWLPSKEESNSIVIKNRIKYPGHKASGGFGIDPYRVSKTVSGKGSKGAMHGYATHNIIGAPNNAFFLEYISRPDTKEIFHDDMIKAMVYYGMPALIENNVNSLLEEMFRRGYKNYSLKRPDKSRDKLSFDEERFGGIPSNSENVLQMQAAAIEEYVELYVGELGDEMGNMPFNNTLVDWLVFNIKDRTKRDASISSSLALMACNKKKKRKVDNKIKNNFVRAIFPQYSNEGNVGKRIN